MQQLRMVGLRNQSDHMILYHANTEGERVKPDQIARGSAYWLERIMRALIGGPGSTGESARPDSPPQQGWGTAELTLDAVSLLCRRLNKLLSSRLNMLHAMLPGGHYKKADRQRQAEFNFCHANSL